MPIFIYEAKDGPEKKIQGEIDAPSQKEAIEKIHEMGWMPVIVTEKPQDKNAGISKSGLPIFVRPPRAKDVTVFTQQLASLIKSGVPIIKGILIIAQQSENVLFRMVLSTVAKEIGQGETFSGALQKFPAIFPALYVSMVKAGENSGQLSQVLSSIAGYRRKSEDSMAKTKTAMVYPAIMGLVGLGTIIFMLVFVMPRIIRLFTTLKQALPTPTKIVISISTFLREEWYWLLLGVMALALITQYFSKTKAYKKIVSVISLKLPVVGDFVKMLEFARFSRTMELLVRSGIPILKTLELATPVVENEIIRKELVICYKSLKEGGSLGRSLSGSKVFPPFMINLITVAEESGKFDEVFNEIAVTYERETDEALKALMSLMEPLMILVMGLVVGFVVISMLLPIFELNMAAQ